MGGIRELEGKEVPDPAFRAGEKEKPCLSIKRLTAWRSRSVPSTRRTVRIHFEGLKAGERTPFSSL